MKKIIVLMAAMAVFAGGCIKSEDKTTEPKKTCETGTVRFTNTSKNPYKIYLDGGLIGSLESGKFYEEEVSKGNHVCKAIQVSGYLFTPTEKSVDVVVPGCGDVEFVFP